MKTLSRISPQKKRKDRYNVYLDGRYSFSVSLDVKEKYRLEKGISVDEEMLRGIVISEGFEKVYNKAINFISYRARTRREIEDRLNKYLLRDVENKKYHDEIRVEVIRRLDDYNLVDDKKFVLDYVAATARSGKNVGKLKVRDFLYKRGISKELVDKYIDNYDDEYEVDKALLVAKKKLKLLGGKRDFQSKGKVYRYLYGRGFTLEAIKSVVDTLFGVQ